MAQSKKESSKPTEKLFRTARKCFVKGTLRDAGSIVVMTVDADTKVPSYFTEVDPKEVEEKDLPAKKAVTAEELKRTDSAIGAGMVSKAKTSSDVQPR